MKTAQFVKLAASTFAVSATLTGCGPASQQARPTAISDQAVVMNKAASFASKAEAILADAKANKAKAVDPAEKAVGLVPTNSSYRNLLGRAYVGAGRFTSAETSFSDALTLEPGNGRFALNLALMKIARGDSGAALGLLEEHRTLISAADYGLALALSGDIVNAISTLQDAARAPDASAKSRQNLGLAYALAGRWIEARVVASQDLSPDLVNQRMGEWAQMASPRAAWDQVAGVLHVTPISDVGQPAQLALVMPANKALAALVVERNDEKADAAEPMVDAVTAAEAPAAVFETSAAQTKVAAPVMETPVAAVAAPVAASTVSMALDDPKPYVAPAVVAPLIRAEPSPLKQAVMRKPVLTNAAFVPTVQRNTHAIQSGQFVVQLGAFSNVSRAETAWDRAAAKVAELLNYDPAASRVKVRGTALHRLSVSGFVTREAASQVCVQVRKSGGSCFVRSVAGDAPMQFVSRGGGTRIAARR
jgi:Flp pilus assembly protein TadD